MEILNKEGLQFLNTLGDGEVDLILTDPPYAISKESGMNKLFEQIQVQEDSGVEFMKTEEDWNKYKKTLKKPTQEISQGYGRGWSKENYLRWGNILGKKYGTQTNFGEWDENFTIEDLEMFIKEYYRVLRKGGTCIIWFDLWKLTPLKEMMERNKFKQIRMIEWVKTNPQPINSKINYLTNSREIALLGVKGGKPTFNSSYDNGLYSYPMAAGWYKFHPTQKNLQLFEELIEKHSNEGDLVVDTFLGGGTTAYAAKLQKRNFKGCELNKDYYKKVMDNLKKIE